MRSFITLMDAVEDYILSDVHDCTIADSTKQNYITRFYFSFKNEAWTESLKQQENDTTSMRMHKVTGYLPITDEDGDIIVSTRHDNRDCNEGIESDILNPVCSSNTNSCHEKSHRKERNEVITIEHKLQTILKEVGFQVWLGALLMCDYLIDSKDSLMDQTVLDLGAGTGLTSIVAAMFAKSVISTDCNQEIVSLAEKNWKRNSKVLPSLPSKDNVTFQVLNWTSHQLESGTECRNTGETDMQHVYDATLIIAAEVVYDDDLTDAFFQTIYSLLKTPPCKSVIMSVEKRIVFDMAVQAVCSPAYEHFQENLKDLCSVDEENVKFTCQQISTQDIPQNFLYTRTAQLELWKITSNFTGRKHSGEGNEAKSGCPEKATS